MISLLFTIFLLEMHNVRYTFGLLGKVQYTRGGLLSVLKSYDCVLKTTIGCLCSYTSKMHCFRVVLMKYNKKCRKSFLIPVTMVMASE